MLVYLGAKCFHHIYFHLQIRHSHNWNTYFIKKHRVNSDSLSKFNSQQRCAGPSHGSLKHLTQFRRRIALQCIHRKRHQRKNRTEIIDLCQSCLNETTPPTAYNYFVIMNFWKVKEQEKIKNSKMKMWCRCEARSDNGCFLNYYAFGAIAHVVRLKT